MDSKLDRVRVADKGNKRIVIMNLKLKHVRHLKGSDQFQLENPRDVCAEESSAASTGSSPPTQVAKNWRGAAGARRAAAAEVRSANVIFELISTPARTHVGLRIYRSESFLAQ